MNLFALGCLIGAIWLQVHVVANVQSLARLATFSPRDFGGHLQQGDELVVSQGPLIFRCIGKVADAVQLTTCQKLDTPSASKMLYTIELSFSRLLLSYCGSSVTCIHLDLVQ